MTCTDFSRIVTHGDAIEGSRERERERDVRAYADSVALFPKA
jgi:hypothetical protein